MHIYCDESGGTDAASSEFLISAVLIDPADADRLLRTFRKKRRHGEEMKGHQLLPEDRQRFFAMLTGYDHAACAAGLCRRDPAGGMVMRTQPEIRIWGGLLTDALCRPQFGRALGVTLDQGRYSKEARAGQFAVLSEALVARWGRRWPLHTGDSRRFAGLQVADVVANTALHAARGGEKAEPYRRLLEQAGIPLILAAPAALAPPWA